MHTRCPNEKASFPLTRFQFSIDGWCCLFLSPFIQITSKFRQNQNGINFIRMCSPWLDLSCYTLNYTRYIHWIVVAVAAVELAGTNTNNNNVSQSFSYFHTVLRFVRKNLALAYKNRVHFIREKKQAIEMQL